MHVLSCYTTNTANNEYDIVGAIWTTSKFEKELLMHYISIVWKHGICTLTKRMTADNHAILAGQTCSSIDLKGTAVSRVVQLHQLHHFDKTSFAVKCLKA